MLNLHDEPELNIKLSLSSRLKHALRAGAKTVEQIATELNADKAQIRARLNDGNGKWSTKSDDERWSVQKPVK